MKTTLLVHYLPRNERSNTKKLVDAFKAASQGKTILIEHDLIERTPELWLGDNLNAYIMRNYVGEKNPEYDVLLKNFDANIAELKQADYIVIAFPMYNFSVPAVVKAWLDSVIMNTVTFTSTPTGFAPLQSGKAMILSTTGASLFGAGQALEKDDHARPLVEKDLQFLGFETIRIDADGSNMLTDREYDAVLQHACHAITTTVETWYT